MHAKHGAMVGKSDCRNVAVFASVSHRFLFYGSKPVLSISAVASGVADYDFGRR